MATYTKFHQFQEDVYHGVHDFSTDTIQIALSNASNPPSASADAILADITTISTANLDTITIVKDTSGQTTGTYKYVPLDLVCTASGAVPAFQWVMVFNSTATGLTNPLIAYFDYGSEKTLDTGETLTLDFGTELFQSS